MFVIAIVVRNELAESAFVVVLHLGRDVLGESSTASQRGRRTGHSRLAASTLALVTVRGSHSDCKVGLD
jgi:hypothetical protein